MITVRSGGRSSPRARRRPGWSRWPVPPPRAAARPRPRPARARRAPPRPGPPARSARPACGGGAGAAGARGGVRGTPGLDGGEHELAPHLDVVLPGPPVPDAEPDGLLRQALLPQHADGRGKRRAGGLAVRRGGEALERLVAVVVHGEPAELHQRVPGPAGVRELLGERPDGVIRRLLRVALAMPLGGPTPDDV